MADMLPREGDIVAVLAALLLTLLCHAVPCCAEHSSWQTWRMSGSGRSGCGW